MQRPHTDFVRTTGPVPSLFGILSPATTVVEDSTDSWVAGFTYDIGDARVSIKNRPGYHGNGGEAVVAAPNEEELLATYLPFMIESTFHTSTFGLTPEVVQARAAEALDVVTQKAIEREFWTGEIAKLYTGDNADLNRYLASPEATVVNPVAGTAIKPKLAQALLEEALGQATVGSAGTLHVPRSLSSMLAIDFFDGDKKTLSTKLGNKIVAGSGYLSTGPDGVEAAGTLRWMYATGPVTVRVGAVEYTSGTRSQAVDTRQNTITYTASRPAAVTWATSDLFAVLVDLSLD